MYCILDTETTSLHPGQIGQLSYICLDSNFCVTSAKNHFFTVDEMHPGAEAVHGFSQERLEHLSGGKGFADSLDEIASDLNDKVLVIHNSPFDVKFLLAEYAGSGQEKNRYKEFCTMTHFTDICKIPKNTGFGYKRPKVSELVSFYNCSDEQILLRAQELFASDEIGFHDARFDTAALLCVLESTDFAAFR